MAKRDSTLEKMGKELEKEGYNVIPEGFIKCTCCGKSKSVKQNNFYTSCSPFHKGNSTNNGDKTFSYAPICKSCLLKDFNHGNKDMLLRLLQLIDRPYFPDVWNNAASRKKDNSSSAIFGTYIKDLNLNFKEYTFADGENKIIDSSNLDENQETKQKKEGKSERLQLTKKEKREAIARWGIKWDDYELLKLEQFYHNMKASNRIETPQDEDYLKKLSRLSIKIDECIEEGETGKAKQLGDLYSKYMTDSKFRAMDMTDADKQGGIRTFSQIYQEVEKDDFIPPWEKYRKFLNISQDLVDKTIMHIENFTLRFNKAQRMSEPPEDTPKSEDNLSVYIEGESDV